MAAKKAKLAHEAKGRQQFDEKNYNRYGIHTAIELVEWPAGHESVIVDLNGQQQLAIVDRYFVNQNKTTGELTPSLAACPAIYDAAAKEAAAQKYQDYLAAQ